jgi:hypothetical protein
MNACLQQVLLFTTKLERPNNKLMVSNSVITWFIFNLQRGKNLNSTGAFTIYIMDNQDMCGNKSKIKALTWGGTSLCKAKDDIGTLESSHVQNTYDSHSQNILALYFVKDFNPVKAI